MWAAIHQWNSWATFKALPSPGPLSEQDARLLAAIGIIESESTLVSHYRMEVETERARRRNK
jgi:hypothetical protein